MKLQISLLILSNAFIAYAAPPPQHMNDPQLLEEQQCMGEQLSAYQRRRLDGEIKCEVIETIDKDFSFDLRQAKPYKYAVAGQ